MTYDIYLAGAYVKDIIGKDGAPVINFVFVLQHQQQGMIIKYNILHLFLAFYIAGFS